MQEELEEPGVVMLEEVPTTSAFQMIQTTSENNLEFSPVYGAEYQTWGVPIHSVHHHNVPCAVCYASTRVAVIMIPAKTQCPSTWTLEYSGYLIKIINTIVPCLSVLTRTQTLFQGVLQMLMVQCSTIQKPPAQDWLVHLLIPRKN